MWELMVLGEPLLVMGDTPTVCGDMVWALLELIKPVFSVSHSCCGTPNLLCKIPFGGEFRPYFTIQDPDFKLISARNRVRFLDINDSTYILI